jgi:hypothetical protein
MKKIKPPHIMKSFIIAAAALLSLAGCSNYGKKVSHDYLEVYYTDGMSEQDAQKTLDYVYPLWKDESGKTIKKSIQLTKGTGDTINFRMVVNKEKSGSISDDTFIAMSNEFSTKLFNGAPVNLVLTDDRFKAIRTLVFKKMNPEEGYGTKYASGNIEVFVKGDIGSTTATEMAGLLEKYFQPQSTYSFQMSKNENNDFVVKMVVNPDKIDKITTELLTEISTKISNEVLSGSSLLFQLTDSDFKPLRTFAYPADAAQAAPAGNK